MKIVKVAILVLVFLATETVMGIMLFRYAKTVAFDGIFGGYERDVKISVERFDDLILSGKTLPPDFTGSLDGSSVEINGNLYTADENTARNLKGNAVNIYTLSELCTSASADGFINSDNNTYVIYGSSYPDETVSLSFLSINALTAGFPVYGFDGLFILSESRRAVYVFDRNGENASFKQNLNYKLELPENGATFGTIKDSDITYAFTVVKLSSANLYLGGYADFMEGQAALDTLSRRVAIALAAVGLISVVFIFIGAYFTGGVENSSEFYFFTTDSDGRIIKADKSFQTDFPDAKEIRERINRFDENGLYAITLPQNGEKKILVCKIGKRFNGTVSFTARKLTLPFGTEIETERKDTMASVYETLSAKSALLVGEIFFENIQEIKNAFGREFTEDVRNILIDRIRNHFGYVFQFDYYNIGVIQAEGKGLQVLLRDMERVVSEFNRVVKIGYNAVLVSVKCGFALSDDTMEERGYNYVMAAADAALKRAIDNRGQNIDRTDYYVYREAQKKLYAKYLFKIDIPKMLENGDFYLEYQPQYGIKEDRIVGFEALFRVNKRARINISMAEIINYAEQSGNMVILGDFIFNEGMRFAKSIEGKGVSVSLNVSIIQLMQTGFVDNFLKIYRFYDLKPNSVSIEITESYLMQTEGETLKKLEILKENGIDIHLDDFGTKYSSFNYLKDLPISAIKIDRSFIEDVDKNEYSGFITATIINIAKNLRLKSICEGVEKQSQLNTVKARGCDIIQGFLISKSVDEATAREMIDTYRYTEKETEDGKKDTDGVTDAEQKNGDAAKKPIKSARQKIR